MASLKLCLQSSCYSLPTLHDFVILNEVKDLIYKDKIPHKNGSE